jgi:hypothetical protein
MRARRCRIGRAGKWRRNVDRTSKVDYEVLADGLLSRRQAGGQRYRVVASRRGRDALASNGRDGGCGPSAQKSLRKVITQMGCLPEDDASSGGMTHIGGTRYRGRSSSNT